MEIKSSQTFIASRHTNSLCDSSQQQRLSAALPESEEWSCTEDVCVCHWENSQATYNEEQSRWFTRAEDQGAVQSQIIWDAWPVARWRELRSSHQFVITFGRWEHEILDSLFQFKANEIKWFFLVPLILDLTEKKKKCEEKPQQSYEASSDLWFSP